MQRVVITGAGTINPLGVNVPATFEAMREGRCGIGPLDIRDVDRSYHVPLILSPHSCMTYLGS